MTQVIEKIKYSSREEWLKLRSQGIGGSDAPAVCGLDPYKSPLQVYMEKIGEVSPPPENRYMEWGKILEPIVAGYFQKKTGMKVSRVNQILVNPKWPFMIGNIDRRIVGKKEGLEIKTTSAWNAGRLKEGIPDEYAVQCYHYLAVTGWERWHLAVLIGGNDFRHFIIERDEEIIDSLVKIEKNFWENHVLKRIPPDPDWRDTEIISKLYATAKEKTVKVNHPDAEDLVNKFLELSQQEKEIKQKKEEVANKIKMFLGECELGIIGKHKVLWKKISARRFDTKKFQKDHPDLYDQYSRIIEYRRFEIR